jgi:DNA-binding MarR family transcriptional regulator
MTPFINQTLILAIENYSGFSPTQKLILKTIIQFENEVPTDVILKTLGLSRQAFHFNTKRLLEEGYIIRRRARIFFYKINKNKLMEVVDTYNTQQALMNK